MRPQEVRLLSGDSWPDGGFFDPENQRIARLEEVRGSPMGLDPETRGWQSRPRGVQRCEAFSFKGQMALGALQAPVWREESICSADSKKSRRDGMQPRRREVMNGVAHLAAFHETRFR